MQNAQRSLNRYGREFNNIGSKLSLGVTTPLLGIAALSTKVAADFETLRTSLVTAFEGNEKAAKQAFDQINEFAAKTPFQVDQVAESFVRLKNLGLDPSERALTSYGNTASAMGKSLNQVIEAVADAATGEFERLKEFGIKARQQGDRVTFTFKGVETEVKKDANSIQEYLLKIGEVDFAGGMERQSKTFQGRLSTLQDSLKLLANDFGEIIIEAINPFIDKIGDIAAYFRELSPETKKMIVVIGGLAAAVGPLLVALGFLVSNVLPGLVTAFGAVRAAILALNTAVLANPWTALAVAVGAVVVSLVALNRNADKAVKTQSVLSKVSEDAQKSIAKEKARLEELLFIARDEQVSKQQRVKAIKELNKISPKYLGDLTLEKINTDKARASIDLYNESLLRTATIKAAQERLEKIQAEIINIEIESSKNRQNSIEKTRGVQELGIKSQEKYNNIQIAANKISELRIAALKKDQLALLELIKANDVLNISLDEGAKKTEGARVKVKALGDDWIFASANITAAADIFDSAFNKISAAPTKLAPVLSKAQAAAIEVAAKLRDAVGPAIQDAAVQIATGFGGILAGFATGNAGLRDLANLMLSTLGDLMIRLGEIAIQAGIGMAAIKAAFESINPAVAIAAGVALIAFGNIIKSAISTAPGEVALASGGLITGETLAIVGDNRNAAFDPEVVAPLSKLRDFIDPGAGAMGDLNLSGEFTVKGTDLSLVLSRVQKRRVK